MLILIHTRNCLSRPPCFPANNLRLVEATMDRALSHRRGGIHDRDGMDPIPPRCFIRTDVPSPPLMFERVTATFSKLDQPLSHSRDRRHYSISLTPPSPQADSIMATSLVSNLHGRRRRRERRIPKATLKMARRYGMKERARGNCVKYTFRGVTFIYDAVRNKEVTCYRQKDARKRVPNDVSGTFAAVPILMSKRPEYETSQVLQQHEKLRQSVCNAPEKWASHSVIWYVSASCGMAIPQCHRVPWV